MTKHERDMKSLIDLCDAQLRKIARLQSEVRRLKKKLAAKDTAEN